MALTYEVSSIARKLMTEHGLGNWSFEFDRSTKRFGVCRYGRRIIGLSEPLVRANTVERCTETILHEIAHALAGSGAGHGPVWKRQARALGIAGDRCYSAETTTLVGKYFSYCERCGDRPISSRVQAPTEGFICRKHKTKLVWKDARGRVVQPKTRVAKAYTVICPCCGIVGTINKRPRATQRHKTCGNTVQIIAKTLVNALDNR